MVDIYIEIIKRNIEEALNTPSITFDQVHYVLRQAVKDLYDHDSRYKIVIDKYYEDEQEILNKMAKASEELSNLRKQLAGIDSSLHEAIKKL